MVRHVYEVVTYLSLIALQSKVDHLENQLLKRQAARYIRNSYEMQGSRSEKEQQIR
jgi:hypothetical protein